MKSITVNGRTFQYQIYADPDQWGDNISTCFYDGTETIKHKKYWLWGEIISKEEPKIVFELPFNIEDDHLTKGQVRERLERAVELLTRREQIQRGEII